MQKDMLKHGLQIIANCKSKTGDIWEAHFGVAAIAAYFFIQENHIPSTIADTIFIQAQAMLDYHSSIETNASIAEVKISEVESALLQSLQFVMDDLHWVGHNVIYTALSVKAIRELGEWGTSSDIAGICTLIESFRKTIPGRSWLGYSAAQVKRLEITEGDAFPTITNAKQLSEFVVGELSYFETIYRAEAHHDLIGHMLTFSHSLNILFDLGYVEYFERGLPALLKLVKVLRASQHLSSQSSIQLYSSVDQLPLVKAKRSEWLPAEEQYWATDFAEVDWDFGHVFKFPFSFYNHLHRIDAYAPSAMENFRYIIYSPIE
ncbi:hypothetical protein [Paenibacillus kandeliae]|uniref:hypothetical protein n=1 Tax=Paenibacillus kandeliae TaxID=3231269 RepID=UPI003459FE8D